MSVPIEQVFYGRSEAAPATDAAKPGAPTADQTAAAKVDGQAKGADAGERKSDEEVLFGDPSTIPRDFEPHIGQDVDRIAAELSLSPEERTAFVQETGQIFRELGVHASDSAQWIGLYSAAVMNPPTPEQDTEWRREGLAQLNERYGYQEAHRRIERVKEFLRLPQNETLRTELESTRLGNHPKVLAGLCQIADRLKVPKKT
jgi:hypothetical protein